jgi:hypothetical protein
MSFLGSIGHLLAGSGLQELLEFVYASDAVGHMLSDKAIARDIRGHLLVDAALNAMLMKDLYGTVPSLHSKTHAIETETTDNEQLTQHESLDVSDVLMEDVTDERRADMDITAAGGLYDKLMTDTCSVEDVCTEEALNRIREKVENKMATLTNLRTSCPWMQYMRMVDILLRFIKAERTGNWDLHLQTLRDILPYFTASGHHLYAKSAYVYLQMMWDLEQDHPDVHRSFQNGLHVARRSDRYWAGLSTDLMIEQVLMRSVKTSGGLTRGRGMTETQRLVWLLSMPICAEVNEAMQQFTGVTYHTSEQHTDTTPSRQERDATDTRKLVDYLTERNPFSSEDSSLRSIASGVTAESAVNVDRAKEVGDKILASMDGQCVQEYVFKRKEQSITLASRTTVKINDDTVQVDAQLLFQRLVFAAEDRYEDPQSLFKYELSSHPPALFDSSGLPRQASKPALADAIWNIVQHDQTGPTPDVRYVLDGGALVQRLSWPRGVTYDTIYQLYVNYVTSKYGQATVVFDGYHDGPSTKDVTHMRRTGACTGPIVNFANDMILSSKKDIFLANNVNKQRCFTKHSKRDADCTNCTNSC